MKRKIGENEEKNEGERQGKKKKKKKKGREKSQLTLGQWMGPTNN